MDNKTLASVVKDAREKLGISQRELSRRTGIDNNTVAKIEKGERKKPNVLSLRKISVLLKIDLEELLKLSGYNDQDIEIILHDNRNNFIFSSGNSPLISIEDLINQDEDELVSRKILTELMDNIDYDDINYLNNLSPAERKNAIKCFKKFQKDNQNEIKNLKKMVEKGKEILNKD